MSGRVTVGGTWLDRSRPVEFTFDGRELTGFAGDTVASALLANGVVGGFRSPLRARPRGVFAAGVEEPNAFVEVSAPWFEAIQPATMVNLVDHLAVESRPGLGRLPDPGTPVRPAAHAHRHVETLVIGAGAAGRTVAAEAAAAGGRVLLIDEHARIDDPPAGVESRAATTALGIYDDGYVVCHGARRREGCDHARPRARGRPRDRRPRASHRLRRQRPARA